MPRRLPPGALVAALAAPAFALCALASATPARAAEIARFALPAGGSPSERVDYAGPVVIEGTVVWGQQREDGSWTLYGARGGRSMRLAAFSAARVAGQLQLTAAGPQLVAERVSLLVNGDPRSMDYSLFERDLRAGRPDRPLTTLDSWKLATDARTPACWARGFSTLHTLVEGPVVAWVPCAGPGSARVLDLATGAAGPPIPLPPMLDDWQLAGRFVAAAEFTEQPSGCGSPPCFREVVTVRRWSDGAQVSQQQLATATPWKLGSGGEVVVGPQPVPSRGWHLEREQPPLPPAPPGTPQPVDVYAVAPDGARTTVAHLADYGTYASGSTDGTTAALLADQCGVERLITTAIGADPISVPAPRCPPLVAGPARLGRDGRLRFSLACRSRCRGVVRADLLTAGDAYDFTPPALIGRRRIDSVRRSQSVALVMPPALRRLRPDPGALAYRVRLRLVDEDAARHPLRSRYAVVGYRRSGL